MLRPLIALAGPERLESGWWSLLSAAAAAAEGQELALREDYVARSPHAGLLWVYRRSSAGSRLGFCRGFIANVWHKVAATLVSVEADRDVEYKNCSWLAGNQLSFFLDR